MVGIAFRIPSRRSLCPTFRRFAVVSSPFSNRAFQNAKLSGKPSRFRGPGNRLRKNPASRASNDRNPRGTIAVGPGSHDGQERGLPRRVAAAKPFVELDAVEDRELAVDAGDVAQVQVAVTLADEAFLDAAQEDAAHQQKSPPAFINVLRFVEDESIKKKHYGNHGYRTWPFIAQYQFNIQSYQFTNGAKAV